MMSGTSNCERIQTYLGNIENQFQNSKNQLCLHLIGPTQYKDKKKINNNQNTNIESLFEDAMNESNLNITISRQQLRIIIDRTSYFLGGKKGKE